MQEEKTKTRIGKNKEGYGYKYTELAQINEYCEENGIKYYQEIETCEINQCDYMVTYVSENGGDYVKHRGCKIVEAVLSGIKNPVQEYGSSLTYCRRYSLLMALGLATEDDDGASLTVKEEATLEDAEKYVLDFGKHKGELLKDVVEEDDSYTNWLFGSEKTNPIIKQYITLLTGKVELSDEEEKEILTYMSEINTLVALTGTDFEDILKHYQVKTTADMTLEQLKDCKATLEKKKAK